MTLLISILVGLILLCLILWAANRILAVTPVPEPFKTILYVLVVVVAVVVFLQYSGLTTYFIR